MLPNTSAGILYRIIAWRSWAHLHSRILAALEKEAGPHSMGYASAGPLLELSHFAREKNLSVRVALRRYRYCLTKTLDLSLSYDRAVRHLRGM